MKKTENKTYAERFATLKDNRTRPTWITKWIYHKTLLYGFQIFAATLAKVQYTLQKNSIFLTQ